MEIVDNPRVAEIARCSDESAVSGLTIDGGAQLLVVCAAGGVLGILVGILAGFVLRYTGMTVIFSLTPAVLAFTCASATGLIFGYLPARKAAQLDPVIALASE